MMLHVSVIIPGKSHSKNYTQIKKVAAMKTNIFVEMSNKSDKVFHFLL